MLRAEHPCFTAMLEEWEELADLIAGPSAVKAKSAVYLKPTTGMQIDGMLPGQIGFKNYEAYKDRGTVPHIFETAVKRILGVLHRYPASVTLPKSMESLFTDATGDHTTIYEFIRAINEEQLKFGRASLLGDIAIDPVTKKIRPIVKIYKNTAVPIWSCDDDNKINYVVLNETAHQLDENYKYSEVKQYRVIRLLPDEDGNFRYVTATTNDESANVDALSYIAPNAQGKTLPLMPFSFVNAGDTHCDISAPPLSALKSSCLTIYKLTCDYHLNLHSMANETLVISGRKFGQEDEDVRTGYGAKIELQEGGSASFIGASSLGLQETRVAIENEYEKAHQLATMQSPQSKSNRDSSTAISLREESMLASYSQMAIAGAQALENVLRQLAPLFNVANPEKEIEVRANLQFTNSVLGSSEILDLTTSKQNGLKISDASMHKLLQKKGIVETTFDEEQILLSQEEQLLFDE